MTFADALPLGILCHRVPRLRAAILGTLNVVQTIPAIALFGILMAPLGALAAAVTKLGDVAVSLGDSLGALEVNPLWVNGSQIEALDVLVITE